MLLVNALLFAGCSGSSSSVSDMNGAMEDDTVTDQNASGFETAMQGDNTANSISENIAEPESEQPAPQTPTTTLITFDITVPAYVSNALQVRLTWGSMSINANWVGDELWTTTASFPTNTLHTLSVTFYDNNGDIELASFTQEYKTGIDDAESFQISAEQFNTEQWDTDEDGSSNIAELLAGTDPLVDELALLEVRDTTQIYLGFTADYFESRITNQRPYYAYSEEQPTYYDDGRPPSGAAQTIEINIDEQGNGTLSDTRQEGFRIWLVRTSYTGTRTHTENAIQWEASRSKHEDPINLTDTTSTLNKVSVINEQTRQYEETYTHTYNPSDEDRKTIEEVQIELTGEIIEGTSLCQPVAGTVQRVKSYGGQAETNQRTETTSISKEIDDQYWKIKSVTTGNDPTETAYFSRELDSTFQCVFVEF